MFFFLLIATVVFIGYMIHESNKAKEENERKIAAQRIRNAYLEEYESIIRVFNGSIEIIKKTKNIETLKSRFDLANQMLDKIKIIEDQGYFFGDKSESFIRTSLPGAINTRILEIAQEEFNDLLSKKDTYASIRSAINALTKTQQKLVELKNSLIPRGEDFVEAGEAIALLGKNLKEEAIIGQVKEYIEKAEKEKLKGNNKKSSDLYIDAAYFLSSCGVESDRLSEIKMELEGKSTSI